MHIYICLPQPAFPLHPNSRLALRSFEQSSLAPMASHHMLLAVLVILAAAVAVPRSAIAADFTVGDDSGWLPNFNYSSWTQGKEFRVGDNLVFKYMQGAHNVMQVGGPDFKACNTSAVAINTFTSGNDLVALDTPGRRWYMCGFGDHCTRGQKLVVNILPAAISPASPPASPPSGPASPPPSPPPLSPASPPTSPPTPPFAPASPPTSPPPSPSAPATPPPPPLSPASPPTSPPTPPPPPPVAPASPPTSPPPSPSTPATPPPPPPVSPAPSPSTSRASDRITAQAYQILMAATVAVAMAIAA
ncbi:unnamed protein product [Musa banksii]